MLLSLRVSSHIYFVSRFLLGVEAGYQNLEKATLAIVITTCRLRYCFKNSQVIVKTDLPVKQVLQELDSTGRMMN